MTADITTIKTESDILLCEAVHRDCYDAVSLLLDFIKGKDDSNQCSVLTGTDCNQCSVPTETDRNKVFVKNEFCDFQEHAVSKALINSAKNGNFQILKLFLSNGFGISEPHDFGCVCSVCSVDRLGQSKRRIEHLKALSNPVWIGLTSTDPFLTAFKIYKKCKTLGRQEDCFEKTYHQLKDDCQRFCCELLDQLESENEVICLMKYDEIRVKENGHLSFIKLAIEYEQKEVRTQWCQHDVQNLH